MTDDELNDAVAERVMGWQRDTNEFDQDWVDGNKLCGSPNFLADDWSGVRLVVERMTKLDFRIIISDHESGAFHVQFWTPAATDRMTYAVFATADTLPRATCLAALKAV